VGGAAPSAVAGAGLTVQRLAVPDIPRSGKPFELMDRFGISARHIVAAVRAIADKTVGARR
jgi:transketolase